MQLGGIVAPFPPTKKCNTSKKYPDLWRYIMPKMTGGDYWSDDDGVIGVALATDMMERRRRRRRDSARTRPDARTTCPAPSSSIRSRPKTEAACCGRR